MRLSIIFAFLISMSCLSVLAQNLGIDTDLSSSKMKARAKDALSSGDVYTALFYYEEIVKRDSSDIDDLYQVAEMYRFSRNYKNAEDVYSLVNAKSPTEYPFALYYKALMQKMSGKYEIAKQNFLLFRKQFSNIGDKSFKSILNKEIAGCDSGIVYRDFPENIRIKNVGNSVNHPHTEFSPVLMDSTTLLFGSLRVDSVNFYDTRTDFYQKQPVRQIYEAEKVMGQWEEKGLFDVVNDPDMDMGNFVYSAYSNRYYFTKCTKDHNQKVTCHIYYTEKINGKWAAAAKLPTPINMEGYTSTQPSIVIDTATTLTPTVTQKVTSKNMPPSKTPRGGNKPTPKAPVPKIEYLYFVSDRPEGKGGLDIWYTYYNTAKKVWTEPANFSAINTTETECSPFFHVPTQTFYFSSNGQISAGGLDIYKMDKEGKRFLKPQNLSFPINSPQDELNFMLSDNGKNGFLVSNRPGGTPYFHETCCDDIYSFEIIPPPPFICTLDLSVKDLNSKTDCKGKLLQIQTYDLKTKLSASDTVYLEDCKYTLVLDKNKKYAFSLTQAGYVNDTLYVETRDNASSPILEKELTLTPLSALKKYEPVIEKPVEGATFVLKDIQYDVNQTTLNDYSKAVLDTILIPFLKKHPTDKISITSHTDDLGSHKYNMSLSQQRADNVMKYLVAKGISIDRVQAKGYGETKHIAPNQNPDGSDNPIGRSINRRTEFLIIKK